MQERLTGCIICAAVELLNAILSEDRDEALLRTRLISGYALANDLLALAEAAASLKPYLGNECDAPLDGFDTVIADLFFAIDALDQWDSRPKWSPRNVNHTH
ncbi:hypothetical protein EC912_108119 [Luteibacter rhizovicinus]|uniref:Uncharacterized protein n=1 Tax=Luteibacter rhizovicinus TaxID=242606 RepID=A0A4R3YHN6_9GAMM|nr:hypothetical protein EC912_108119 [Luteibacter rhizovicinus]